MSTDRFSRNRANANRPWTCPFCEAEMKVTERADHLLDHD